MDGSFNGSPVVRISPGCFTRARWRTTPARSRSGFDHYFESDAWHWGRRPVDRV